MALRLTGPSAVPDSSTAAPSDRDSSAAELGLQALTLLAALDLDGYQSLFRRAGEREDPHRRYQAEVALLERGLIAAGEAQPGSATKLFVTVARLALETLEREPREPVVLGYAGVAFYELWSLEAGQALFEAAKRLDPGQPHLAQNLSQLARRRRAGRPTRPLHASLPALAGRAKQVARLAKPVAGLTLSLCMIVRDEEQMLARCLTAAAAAVDEIVIVDTGSVDATVEIARSFGARVIEEPWTGSFAHARNASFAAATGDWLLYLDADEVFVEQDAAQLRALTGQVWREAFYLVETSYTGEQGDGAAVTNNALRVFRNRPEYRFEGRVHEQIAHRLPAYAPGRIGHTAIRVEHYGYLGAVREAKEKFRRNVELLRAQAQESAPTPFLHFNLGSEYAGAGDARSAVREFDLAWSMLQREGNVKSCEFAPPLLVRLTKALRACGRPDDAMATAQAGLKLFPELTDLVFEQAITALALGHEEQAIGYYERCVELGDAAARFGAIVGCGTYMPRIGLAELQLEHGQADAARGLLDWCLERYPGIFGVVTPYATALLRTGVAPHQVVAEIERRVATMNATVRFMLATALHRAGALTLAEQQYRIVVAEQAASSQARAALAEVLLYQGHYGDAADQAALVADDDAYAGLACRIELCGRIAGDDLAGAGRALARAQRSGLPAIERDVFAAWMVLEQEGAEAQAPLPAAGAALLGVILETLLRSGAVTRFDALLPLLERSALPQRDQRELLADVYLRQGLLAPAAKQWMAVCSEGPDVRALVGLARVAHAHGLDDDAVSFASGALELDPACAAAIDLLDICASAALV